MCLGWCAAQYPPMPTAHAPVPAPALDAGSRAPAAVVAGLIACIIGCSALVAAAVLPTPLPSPDHVLTGRALHSTVDSITRQQVTWSSAGGSERTASRDQIFTDGRRSQGEANTMRQCAGQERWFKAAPDRLETALARGTRAESAHLATVPVSADVGNFLTAMTWQSRRTDLAFLDTCPCPAENRATD
jgi:hypothetical protein